MCKRGSPEDRDNEVQERNGERHRHQRSCKPDRAHVLAAQFSRFWHANPARSGKREVLPAEEEPIEAPKDEHGHWCEHEIERQGQKVGQDQDPEEIDRIPQPFKKGWLCGFG